jgi:hypothetical protein
MESLDVAKIWQIEQDTTAVNKIKISLVSTDPLSDVSYSYLSILTIKFLCRMSKSKEKNV